jgi:AraC-like DNA-binding protein
MSDGLSPELFRNLDLRVLAVQRAVAGRWWNYHHVISPFSRLWLVLEGRGVVRHHGQQFNLVPGQIHLVPPFTPHDCSCGRRMDHYYIHFVSRLPTGVDLLSMLATTFQLTAPPEALGQVQRLEALYPQRKLLCFDPMQDEYRRQSQAAERADEATPPVDAFEGRGLLALLLTPFLRRAQKLPGIHSRVTEQFRAVQEFIHKNMAQNILLGDLARVAQLNPTYFSDRFQRLVGLRPLAYLNQRRLERAQYLLLTSNDPVKTIAAGVGFQDAAYFTRAFTRYCGCSPSEYRASHAH